MCGAAGRVDTRLREWPTQPKVEDYFVMMNKFSVAIRAKNVAGP
jgi:hypothetical protein